MFCMRARRPSEIRRRWRRDPAVLPWLANLAAVLGLTGAFLYFFGRRYVEAYYGALGIPATSLRFSHAEYVFGAVEAPEFQFLGVSLALLIWGTIRILRFRVEPRASRWRFVGWAVTLAYGIVFVLVTLMLVATYILAKIGYLPALLADNMLFLFSLVDLVLGVGLVLAPYAHPLIGKWRMANLPAVAVAVTVLTAVMFVDGPEAWGGAAGRAAGSVGRATEHFSEVRLHASSPVGPTDLRWERAAGSDQYSSEPLLLILDSTNVLWLRRPQLAEPIYAIPRMDTLGLEVRKPGRADNEP